VRFRSEEVGSSSARGRRSYTHASTKGVHSGDARQLEAEPSLSLLCLKLDLCLKLNSWYSSYICCSQKCWTYSVCCFNFWIFMISNFY
jgi:hypothetical protein